MEDFSTNKKYNDILISAKSLFWKYGFKKVSIEEICREAKTSKVTFYKFFSNKLEIAKAVFDFVVAESIETFKKVTSESESAADLLRGMMKMKKEGVHELSKEFVKDFYVNPELGLKDYIAQRTNEVLMVMFADLKLLQEKGFIRRDLKIEFFIYYVQKYSELIDDPYLNSLYSSPEDLIMELTNFSAYGISPHD